MVARYGGEEVAKLRGGGGEDDQRWWRVGVTADGEKMELSGGVEIVVDGRIDGVVFKGEYDDEDEEVGRFSGR